MSWYIELMGAREAVRAKAIEEFDKNIAMCEGKDEANDIRAVKERALAKLGTFRPETYGNGVRLIANGSDSPNGGSFKLEVYRCKLEL
jgi:hypothetical protein